MDMKRLFLFAAVAVVAVSCASDKVAVIAHRGFWNCEEAGFSENSIASLRCAQEAGLWGSEFDVQLTADSVVIVNHNSTIPAKIDGCDTLLPIAEHTYAEFCDCLLPNGERRPTLDEYLAQGALYPATKLIMELKKQGTEAQEDLLLDKAVEALKSHGMFDPEKVIFISFSRHITERIAEEAPDFTNQYLNGELSPEELSAMNVNGMDYGFPVLQANPEWVAQAREKGLSTNTWTINTPELAREMIALGVQAITTNEPLMIRELLGKREKVND